MSQPVDNIGNREALERQALLAHELNQRLNADAWFGWTPTAKQLPFIEAVLREGATEVWFIAANRSGKSDVAAYCGSALARFGDANPRFQTGRTFRPTKGWVISATANASKSVAQPKFFNNGLAAAENHAPFIPDREIQNWNKNDNTIFLKNGSVIEFKTAEAKTISFAGAGLDWVLIDEECPKSIYDELTIRIGGGRRLRIIGACTLLPPEGEVGGVSWIYDEKIKPWLKDPRAVDWRIFGASIYDNPYLLPAEIHRLESRYPVGSAERAIRLDGEYLPGLQGARAYGNFDARIHVREQPEWQMRRPLCWIWDFNVDPLVSLIGQRDGDLFRVHKELILDVNGSIDEMCQMFHETVPFHHNEIWVYGDATGHNRNSMTGQSSYKIIGNNMRTYSAPMRLKVPNVNPLVTDRINAVNVQFKDQEGVSRIEVDPSCIELVKDFEQVLRDNRGGVKKTHNRRDPYYRRTHTSDAFGYWISYEKPVRTSGLKERMQSLLPKSPGYGRRKP